jgi:hypothetical protein
VAVGFTNFHERISSFRPSDGPSTMSLNMKATLFLVALLGFLSSCDALVGTSVTSRARTSSALFMRAVNSQPGSSRSMTAQRYAKGLVSAALLVGISGRAANAGLFSSAEQDGIDAISSYQKIVAELLDQLKPVEIPNAVGVYAPTQVLKGGKEDSAVVATYMYTHFMPLQAKMAELAPKLKLSEDTQKRVEVLPGLMKGHLLELKQAIAEMTATSQAREVEEIQETLAEFLKLASSKYNVTPFVPSRPLKESELFGPFSCEFWGRTRLPGSNTCVDPETLK